MYSKEKQTPATASNMHSNTTAQGTSIQSPFLRSNSRMKVELTPDMNLFAAFDSATTSSSAITPRPGSALLPDKDRSGGCHTPAPQQSSEQMSLPRLQGNEWGDLGSYNAFDFAQPSATMPPSGNPSYYYPTNLPLLNSSLPQTHNTVHRSHIPPVPQLHRNVSGAQFNGSTFTGATNGNLDFNFPLFTFPNGGNQLTHPNWFNGPSHLHPGSSASSTMSGLMTPTPSEYEATLSRTHTPSGPPPMNGFPANGGVYYNSANSIPHDLTSSNPNTFLGPLSNTGIPTPESLLSQSSPMVTSSPALAPEYEYIAFEPPSYGGERPTAPNGSEAQEPPLTQSGARGSTKSKAPNDNKKAKAPRRNGTEHNVLDPGSSSASVPSAGDRGATFPAAMQSMAGVWGPVNAAGDDQWTMQPLRLGPHAGTPDLSETETAAPATEEAQSTPTQRKTARVRCRKNKRNDAAYQAALLLEMPWLQYRAGAPDYVFTCKFGECADKEVEALTDKKQAQLHLQSVHGILGGTATKGEDKRKCEWTDCPKKNSDFAASSILRHVIDQHSSKPMQCTFPPGCDYRYKRPEDLKSHFKDEHMEDFNRMVAERAKEPKLVFGD